MDKTAMLRNILLGLYLSSIASFWNVSRARAETPAFKYCYVTLARLRDSPKRARP